MKKLLAVLGTVTLVTPTVMTAVACNKNKGSNTELNPFQDNELNGLPTELQNKVRETSFFTKLLLLSRHENLNYYFNDVFLSTFATGAAASMYTAPLVYNTTYKDKNYLINLEKYVNPLVTQYAPLSTFFNGISPGGDRVTAYADMLVGMAGDKFYQDYLTNIKAGNYKFNDIANYLDAGSDARNQLKWADFDTGSLWNYLAGSGIHNEVDHQNKNWSDLFKNDQFLLPAAKSPTGADLNFGDTYGKFISTTTNAHISSVVANYFPLLQNFNGTQSGITYGSQFLTGLFPFINVSSATDELIGSAVLNLMSAVVNCFKEITDTSTGTIAWADKAGLNSAALAIDDAINGPNKVANWPNLSMILIGFGKLWQVQDFFGDGTTSKPNIFKLFGTFATALAKELGDSTKDKEINTELVGSKAYGTIKTLIQKLFGSENSKTAMDPTYLTSNNVLGLLAETGKLLGMVGDNADTFTQLGNTYTGKGWNQLTTVEKETVQTTLGWNKADGSFNNNSIYQEIYNIVNDKNNNGYAGLQALMLAPDSLINQTGSAFAQQIHEDIFQYALLDEYWNISDTNYNQPNLENTLGATLSYSMEYDGVGDATTTDLGSTTAPSFSLNDKNPRAPQTPWTTKSDAKDFVNYDGLGMNANRKDVKHRYDVEWTNVSNDPSQDYWVITKINFYDLSTGNPVLYYNLY